MRVAIVAVNKLVPNVLTAPAERPLYRKLFDAGVQCHLRHAGIRRELSPNGAFEGQCDADMLAKKRHAKFSAKNAKVSGDVRAVDNESHHSLIQAGFRPLHPPR